MGNINPNFDSILPRLLSVLLKELIRELRVFRQIMRLKLAQVGAFAGLVTPLGCLATSSTVSTKVSDQI